MVAQGSSLPGFDLPPLMAGFETVLAFREDAWGDHVSAEFLSVRVRIVWLTFCHL